jgi:hypothetical protein
MILDQVQRLRSAVVRLTPGPLLVRAGVFATGLGALLTAYPADLVASRMVLALALLATMPMVAPGGRWTTLVALAAVGGWLYATMAYQEPITLFRLFGIAGLLYLTHSLAALGAALPQDAVVAPEVLVRWVGRALLVVAASAVPALGVVVIADALRGAYLFASLLGLVVAVTIAGLLAYLQRRR